VIDDPIAWVANVERLYKSGDAAGVSALYAPEARTRFGSRYMTPDEVHEHPAEWFAGLRDYQLSRTFRAATGNILVSETVASYIKTSDGRRYREFGVDIYWLNDDGLILHKHTSEIVEPFDAVAHIEDDCP
jgi:nuclear transport factor 2 (NTF2) superfamily protein